MKDFIELVKSSFDLTGNRGVSGVIGWVIVAVIVIFIYYKMRCKKKNNEISLGGSENVDNSIKTENTTENVDNSIKTETVITNNEKPKYNILKPYAIDQLTQYKINKDFDTLAYNDALETLNMFIDNVEKKDENYINAQCQKALIYLEMENYEEAKLQFENHIELVGTNDIEILLAYSRVLYILKDYDNCIKFYNDALILSINSLGANDILTATIYNNIGTAWYKCNDFKQAIENYEKDLKITIKLFGLDNVSTGMTYSNLASTHYKLNNLKDSIDFYEKALKIFKSHLHEDDLIIASTEKNLDIVKST